MGLTSPWYPFIVTALCLALCAAIARRDPWYRAHLAEAGPGRFESIDGLRGFLAIGVFFTHVIATYGYYAHGRYSTFSPVHAVMGQVGVSIFFMITGFLFWRRALRAKGGLDARTLYLSRIRRLVPMYLVSVALALLVVAVMSGLQLREPLVPFLKELRTWLSFGFMNASDLNGVKDAHIINAVYWTLAYEWSFYLALPLLALFARGWAFVALAAATLFFGIQAPITLNFLAGALAAMAVERGLLNGRLARAWLAPVPLAAIAMVLLAFDEAYHPAAIGLLFVAFLFVVDGNSLFGLLPPRMRLGGAYQRFRGEVAGRETVESNEALACAKLAATLQWAFDTVPAYQGFRGLLDARGDVRDVLQRLPVTDKLDIKRHPERYLSRAMSASSRMEMFTGGSTRNPMQFYLQRHVTRPKEFAFIQSFRERAGVGAGDLVLALRGRTVPTAAQPGGRIWMREPIKRQLILSSDHLEKRYMPAYAEALALHRPTYIEAFPSALFPLARWLAANPLPEFTRGVKGVMLYSENELARSTAQMLERVSPPTPTSDVTDAIRICVSAISRR